MKTYSPVVPINYAFLIRPKLQMQFANNTNPSLEPARLTHIYLKYFFLDMISVFFFNYGKDEKLNQ